MINEAIEKIISPCLWGTSIKSLDMENDKFLIIERILEHGGDKQIEFILGNYKREDIISVINESSYLSPKTVNYWCLFFGLRKEETRCHKKPSLHLWPPS